MARRAASVLHMVRKALVVTGTVLISVFLGVRIFGAVTSRLAVVQFSEAELQQPARTSNLAAVQNLGNKAEFAHWSMERIAAFGRVLSRPLNPPQAVLRIQRIGLETPVFEGTGGLALNRGVGRIIGTAMPGKGGNVGIAGHRDGYFRVLKDVVVGDRIELNTPGHMDMYEVEQIEVVEPSDIRTLQKGRDNSLTLVTCYPFYFVGNAPLRYVVHASLSPENSHGTANLQSSSAQQKTKN